MSLLLATLIIGFVAGLRAMTAPAIASWASAHHWIAPPQGWLVFMAFRWTLWILALAALAEWCTDQLASTPSRTVPMQFSARILMGGLAGATLGATGGSWVFGMLLGAVGSVCGTLIGARCREALARGFGHDRPAAIIEDVLAVALGALAIALA